jgi:cytochrome c-type biogenesis protein CcmE
MGIVAGEGHLGLEVAAVVEGVLVQHDERYAPLEDVFVDELGGWLAGCSACI